MGPVGFDPDDATARALFELAAEFVAELTSDPDRPVVAAKASEAMVAELRADRPGAPIRPEDAFAVLRAVLATGADNTARGDLAYIPGSGLVTSALAELIGAAANRYTGLPGPNPAALALEAGVLSWLTDLFDLPETSQATLLSGGSAANLHAIVAARDKHAPGEVQRATVYVGEHAHASVVSSARIAGIDPGHVRVCGSPDGLRVEPEAVGIAIKQDLADGLVPIAVVGAAGTTNAGTIDPLPQLAELCQEHGVWLHVDAAYGGFFRLTRRGRRSLRGIERADSITLDPHKSLFLPFGTGALLVRDRDDLHRSFAEDAAYLRDLDDGGGLPDLSSLTAELTRDWRGLKLWLPLKLHGVDAFRDALDDKLDLAAHAYRLLAADPAVEVLAPPELSIVTFRVPGDDRAQDQALAAINRDGTIRLSSTVIAGRIVLRLAILSHRTDRATVDGAVARVRQVARAAQYS